MVSYLFWQKVTNCSSDWVSLGRLVSKKTMMSQLNFVFQDFQWNESVTAIGRHEME